jgi:hypothetical protein
MVGRHGSGSSYVYRKGPAPSPPPDPGSKTTLPADRLKEIQAAVEASPSKIVVIFGRDHQVPGKSMHFSTKDRFSDGSPSWDHVAVAWMDANGNLVFAEARPVNGATGVAFFGKNSPGTAREFVTEYKDFKVVPIDLGRYGPGARDAFVNAVSAATGPGSYYSATNKNIGTVCSGVIQKGLDAAYEAHKPTPGAVKYLKESWQRISTLGLNLTKVNLYTPKVAYLDVAKHSVPFRFDSKAPLVKRDWSVVGESKIVVVETDAAGLGAASLAAVAAVSDEAHASPQAAIDREEQASPSGQPSPVSDTARTEDGALHPATGRDEQVSQEMVQDPSDDEDYEDALTDHSPQDLETDAHDDEDALEQELTLASDLEHTPDPAQPPEIDDDEDELTLVSDLEDAPPAIDDDDDEEQADDEEEELAHASDAEDAPTANAPVMQTAKAEVAADATADDQAGPQLATSAPVTADDGFSFSLFPKPGVPLEVAKEAMPAEQASPGEEISSPGVPGSESAHAELESPNVGNAAPSKDPVVHHGDLTP